MTEERKIKRGREKRRWVGSNLLVVAPHEVEIPGATGTRGTSRGMGKLRYINGSNLTL